MDAKECANKANLRVIRLPSSTWEEAVDSCFTFNWMHLSAQFPFWKKSVLLTNSDALFVVSDIRFWSRCLIISTASTFYRLVFKWIIHAFRKYYDSDHFLLKYIFLVQVVFAWYWAYWVTNLRASYGTQTFLTCCKQWWCLTCWSNQFSETFTPFYV